MPCGYLSLIYSFTISSLRAIRISNMDSTEFWISTNLVKSLWVYPPLFWNIPTIMCNYLGFRWMIPLKTLRLTWSSRDVLIIQCEISSFMVPSSYIYSLAIEDEPPSPCVAFPKSPIPWGVVCEDRKPLNTKFPPNVSKNWGLRNGRG